MTFLRVHITTAAVTFVAVAAFFFPGAADLMELSPVAVADGEIWRILTGHVTHCGFSHLFWNVIVFTAFGSCLERRMGSLQMACLLLTTTAGLGIVLWALMPDTLVAYRGLSGVDCVLFVFLGGHLIVSLRGYLKLLPMLMLLGFAAKTLLEVKAGQALFVEEQGMQVVPLAHWVGGILGGAALLWRPWLAPSISRDNGILKGSLF